MIDDIKFIEGNLDVPTSNIEHLEQCIEKFLSSEKNHLNKKPNPFNSSYERPKEILSAAINKVVKALHSSAMNEYHRKLDHLLMGLPTPSVPKKAKVEGKVKVQGVQSMEDCNVEPVGVVVSNEGVDLPQSN